ncbi:Cytochrome b561 [Pseudoalteromonas sp. CIP111854]|uniref:Cytochrome b561 n=1 Tax=Pseudoalteromonas holothuriae TaxID=2963714 RepID=A0A9W4VLR5_9GAMM|nr:cytochrome b/b6 domain-containing protein [Pseudoalteromonas sp. CIP111854]CAH9049973.1 Cytochrome b561 [Pseudoalteromonas sp. CIP111854]
MSYHSLTVTTKLLHWLVGFTMLGLITVGFYMVNLEVWALYPIHKAIGVLALLLIIPRAIYRIKNGFPAPIEGMTVTMQKLAHSAHWLLLLGTLLMPISGMLYSGFGGYGIDVFGLTLVSKNIMNGEVVPINESIFIIAKNAHSLIGYGLSALILAHIAAAFKHHLIDKDATLTRMLSRS